MMLLRMIDHLKLKGITAFLTALTGEHGPLGSTELEVSSLIDTWLLVRTVEKDGERNRFLDIQKSRGMAHSNQVREFLMTDNGVELRDVYVGPGGVLTGSARVAQEVRDRELEMTQAQGIKRRRNESVRRGKG